MSNQHYRSTFRAHGVGESDRFELRMVVVKHSGVDGQVRGLWGGDHAIVSPLLGG